MDGARLAEIEARATAATPGPWTTERPGVVADGQAKGMRSGVTIAQPSPSLEDRVFGTPSGGQFPSADQHLIAAARTDIPDLCAALRQAWAERDAVAEEARALREAADALMRQADEVLREYGGESHISRLSVHGARLDASLSRPRTVHAVVAEERARVCKAASWWLARARQTKAKDDIGQDDWYSAYAEDAAALMAAVDALAEAERVGGWRA